MLNNRKLILDEFCEVSELLRPIADEIFSNLDDHDYVPGAFYVISRATFNLNIPKLRELAEQNIIQIILCNPMEGSATLINHCKYQHKILDLVEQNKIWLISGGEMESKYPYILYDDFLPKILDYDENIKEIELANEIYTKINKPFKFLFLNGRTRSHRKYLLQLFRHTGLLNQSLWTNLDTVSSSCHPLHSSIIDVRTRSTFPIQQLPREYEVDRYQSQIDVVPTNTTRDLYFKYHMFNDEWGDIYIKAAPYIDTYFSLVTETVFEYPYSFRTEKLWKPVAVGHPFIVSSNAGYYRDLRNLGFKTFGHLIDESFDTIDDHQTRMDRLVATVQDLCSQDLPAFLAAAQETCKYNQQHLAEMHTQVRKEFPQRFINFINERSRI